MRKKAIMEDLPLQIGKYHKLSFATGEGFTLTGIEKRKDIAPGMKMNFRDWLGKFNHANAGITSVRGIYEKSPGLGECQIGMGIVRPEQRKKWDIDVCSKCGHPCNED